MNARRLYILIKRTAMTITYRILHHLRNCLSRVLSLFFSNPAFFQTLTFDNGLQVRIGRQIAEGGFSFVFEANVLSDDSVINTTTNTHASQKLAIKRINCADHELLQSCREEASIHRSLPIHDNLLTLLGLKFERDGTSNECNVCYMLFPYIPTSLRGEITERNILMQSNVQQRPFTIKEILSIFGGVLDGLSTMHLKNISHRDVKIENILLRHSQSYRDRSSACGYTPVLMDFGSAGPLTVQLNSRHEILTAIETASQHTTLSYRPPELFEGGLRHYDGTNVLHYGKVDVWSLGCVLFGLMHGCSPFEMEFLRSDNAYDSADGVRIVDCTHLKILGEVPCPSWTKQNSSNKSGQYPVAIYDFVKFMVCQDRMKRPDIVEVQRKFSDLYLGSVGEKWLGNWTKKEKVGNDEFDSLITNRDFV